MNIADAFVGRTFSGLICVSVFDIIVMYFYPSFIRLLESIFVSNVFLVSALKTYSLDYIYHSVTLLTLAPKYNPWVMVLVTQQKLIQVKNSGYRSEPKCHRLTEAYTATPYGYVCIESDCSRRCCRPYGNTS